MKNFFLGFIAAIVLMLIAGLLFVYSGAFNIAATEAHAPITRWVFETVTERSVRRRARGIEVPQELSARAAEGSSAYSEMCVPCHGAPGVERGPMGRGLTPLPPDLAEAARELAPAELFWIVKHGIKMTGMPAWGPTHSDEEIWAIVAFVELLASLSPEQYRMLAPSEAGERHGTEGH